MIKSRVDLIEYDMLLLEQAVRFTDRDMLTSCILNLYMSFFVDLFLCINYIFFSKKTKTICEDNFRE